MASHGVLLQPLNVQNLRGHIHYHLRAAILDGTFKPGERLVESVIAEQLGVSRAPVREVLMALEREGLVNNIPRHGNFVVDFTDKDIEEIYSLRLLLERGALERTIERATEKDLAEIQALVDQLGELTARGGDLHRTVEADLLIHERICRAADHGRLLQWWNSIRWQTQLLIGVTSRTTYDYPTQPQRNHQAILDPLRAKDLASAEAALVAHMGDAQARAHRALREVHTARATN
ncbi:MAG: GntR family transcriptional regulator [Chloroflexi bacterium]|nr:GntR family transcriptional regulator [Chloroflexota bacterium]